jgi:hypothetical protein
MATADILRLDDFEAKTLRQQLSVAAQKQALARSFI